MHYTLWRRMPGVECHARLNDKRKKIHNCNYGANGKSGEDDDGKVESIKCNSSSSTSTAPTADEQRNDDDEKKANRKSQNRADQFSIQP